MSTTPMMLQWQQCKAKVPETLLFFRLGDFYEAFEEDAQIISKALHLTLTQRQGIPMCGVPAVSCDLYLDKLLTLGYRVAIADQTEDAKQAKGLVRREVTRIVTPGTLVQSQLLSEKKNNFFVSLSAIDGIFGLARLDVTTAEFAVAEIRSKQELIDELFRLKPAECLVPRSFLAAYPDVFRELSLLVKSREEKAADYETLLREQFRRSIELGQSELAAAGALLLHLREDLGFPLDHVRHLQRQPASFLSIDRSTMRHLEILEPFHEGGRTLIDLLDQTCTPMGARLLRRIVRQPSLCLTEIRERQDAVEEMLSAPARLRALLDQVRDLERLMMKILCRKASPRDLIGLMHSLTPINQIKEALGSKLSADAAALHDLSPLIETLRKALVPHPPLRLSEGGIFQDGYHAQLDELRQLTKDAQTWLLAYQQQLRDETGIKTLKVAYAKAFGYSIEISHAAASKAPPEFRRRQTLVNCERFTTDPLQQFEQKLLHAEERIKSLESALFDELIKEIGPHSTAIYDIAQSIARIDLFQSFARCADEYGYVRPTVDASATLDIRQGRHPVIERALALGEFIPNDLQLNGEARRLMLITGPNMAGKSTYLRQSALLILMAQTGSFIPAASAHIGLVDKIFSRIGASDDLSRGQSTFMVEMSESAYILQNATSRSFIILDELGRGTSTYDGISIAWAVAEYILKEKHSKTLFATHYWELTALSADIPGAINAQVAVQETTSGIVFLHQILPGTADKSYGIHVARLAGLPDAVIQRAQQKLCELEQN